MSPYNGGLGFAKEGGHSAVLRRTKCVLATKTHGLRGDWKMVVDEKVVMCNEAAM
jgi:hypothetical protein